MRAGMHAGMHGGNPGTGCRTPEGPAGGTAACGKARRIPGDAEKAGYMAGRPPARGKRRERRRDAGRRGPAGSKETSGRRQLRRSRRSGTPGDHEEKAPARGVTPPEAGWRQGVPAPRSWSGPGRGSARSSRVRAAPSTRPRRRRPPPLPGKRRGVTPAAKRRAPDAPPPRTMPARWRGNGRNARPAGRHRRA